MLLVQDQCVQNSRKNFDSEIQLKQTTLKQAYPDSKEVWDIESGCEEEINTSGNDTEGDDFLYADPSDIPEVLDNRRQILPRKKNVRFGGPNFNCMMDTSETSSFDNEYPGLSCAHLEGGPRRPSTLDPEMHKGKDQFRAPQKIKWQAMDYGCDRTRPQSSPEKIAGFMDGMEKRQMGLGEFAMQRGRRKEHRCGRHHPLDHDFDDITCRKPVNRMYKFESGDDLRCCDHCVERKNFLKMKPVQHKHGCHTLRETEGSFRKMRFDSHYDPHPSTDRCCPDEYYDHYTKTKKKTLEAVQEQQELLSDSTYKLPCSKFSSQTVSGEMMECPRKKSLDKLTNSSVTDWLYYSSRGTGTLAPPKMHKTRSRRTRMNRVKSGWKKALVQTVRDGNRNERVGVLVMGAKGPEFYAKNAPQPGVIPFRKSKSFLDSAGKSFDVMTIDCKNVFLSSSEPGPRASQNFNDLVYPEDDLKVEEKMARYSKNVSDIVKHTEEKFYKALSSSEYPEGRNLAEGMFKGAGEGIQEEKKEEKTENSQKLKLSPKNFPLFSVFSPRMAKLRSPTKKVSEDSKAMASLLNEQGKQFLENQSRGKEESTSYLDGLKELSEKLPPMEISKETAEANLSLWGMKLEQLSEKTETKEPTEDSKGEEGKRKEKLAKDEVGSGKSGVHTCASKQTQFSARLKLDEGEGPSKTQSSVGTPKRSSRTKTWESQAQTSGDGDPIETVFRDLVENGCRMSQEELENLQNVLGQGSYNPEVCSNEVLSSTSSEVPNTTRETKINVSPRSPPKSPYSAEENKGCRKTEREKKEREDRKESEGKKENLELENVLGELSSKKVRKTKNCLNESLDAKLCKKNQGKLKEGKSKKKVVLEDRMKLLRQALPSLAAENEAAHLKQLKRYIDRFIDRVEASTLTEFSKRKDPGMRLKDSPSTDSSEVRVDGRKILDFISNPFKKISSDVTINIAKKLTDALVQDKAGRCPKHSPPHTRTRKHSDTETDDDAFTPCNASSGSERFDEPEPAYLKQLKKMRNEHLNNIVLEVKRLSELLRFLDRCNRLHS